MTGRNILDLLTLQGLKPEVRTRILSPDRSLVFASDIELVRSDQKRFVWLNVADVVMCDGAKGHYFVIEEVHESIWGKERKTTLNRSTAVTARSTIQFC